MMSYNDRFSGDFGGGGIDPRRMFPYFSQQQRPVQMMMPTQQMEWQQPQLGNWQQAKEDWKGAKDMWLGKTDEATGKTSGGLLSAGKKIGSLVAA